MTTRRLVLRAQAQRDLVEARDWYDGKRAGLGLEFLDEFERVTERVLEFPHLYQVSYRNIRRGFLGRFPYSVFYVPEAKRIVVLRVLHDSRDPASRPRN